MPFYASIAAISAAISLQILMLGLGLIQAVYYCNWLKKKEKKRIEEPEFLANRCILCGALFSAKYPALMPDLTEIQSIFAACSEYKDEVGLRPFAKQFFILDRSAIICYHKHCWSADTCKLHLRNHENR